MESVEELTKIAHDAQEKLRRIEFADRAKRNGPLVGKTFKYRNCYSCPEKPSDYWWMYAKVTRMGDDGLLYLTTFQTDKYGNMEVRFEHLGYHMQGYHPVPASEFNRAWKTFQKRIASAL